MSAILGSIKANKMNKISSNISLTKKEKYREKIFQVTIIPVNYVQFHYICSKNPVLENQHALFPFCKLLQVSLSARFNLILSVKFPSLLTLT